MQLVLSLFLCGLIGLFAGFMSGMFGIGGGSIRTPLLNIIGLDLIYAFGINLLTIPFSSSLGAYSQRKHVRLKIGGYMMIGGSIGAGLGALVAFYFAQASFKFTLVIIYVVISIISIVGMYLYKLAPKIYEKLKPNPPITIGGTFILNLLTGMRGGSGGSLFPAFLRTMGIETHESIATSLFATIATASIAIVLYWWKGQILWLEGSIVVVGSMIGVWLGSLISIKTKPKWLQLGLVFVLIVLTILTLIKAIFW